MRKLSRIIMHSRYGWLIGLVLVALLNIAGSVFHARFDLTKEKRYTLSASTISKIRSLDDVLEIDVFLKGDFPASFKKLANSTAEFLSLFKELNGSKVRVRFVSPSEEVPGTNRMPYSDSLIKLGAMPINLKVQLKQGESQSLLFPVAVMKYHDKQGVVEIFKSTTNKPPAELINSAEAMLEYNFISVLGRLSRNDKPLIAYSFGNGEPNLEKDYHTASLQQTLFNDYQLFHFNLNTQPVIPDTFKALMVVKPTLQFTESEKLKIDQYLMRGGKLIFFVDNLYAEQDSLQFKSQLVAFDRGLGLTDLLFNYGVRINPDLIMDLQCDYIPLAVGGDAANPQYEFVHWNYYPLFESGGNHTINKNIGLVSGRFVNSLDTIATPGIRKTVLLASSPNSRSISTPALISLNENKNAPEDAKFRKSHIPAAMLLEGKFSSMFQNRISRLLQDSLASFGTPFTGQSLTDSKVIVVGDGDLVLNDVSPKDGPLPMGMNFYTLGTEYEVQYSNRDFLLNCLQYMVSDPGIIETRNKDIVLRLLDGKKVEGEKLRWQLVNTVVPILLVILAGFIYQQTRKRKYAVSRN